MKRPFVHVPTLLALILFMSSSLTATNAEASWAEIWVRGDGSFIGGDENLRYFSSNDAGPGYGFALGVEVLQVDLFADINIHPNGSMFNLLGLGLDFDLVPGDRIYFAPAANVAYFFGPHEGDAESDRGFLGRAGAQFEVTLFPMVAFGLEGYFGGMLSYYGEAELEKGWMYSGAAYLVFRFGI